MTRKSNLVISSIFTLIVGILGTALIFINYPKLTKTIVENVSNVQLTETSIADAVDKIYNATVVVVGYKGGSKVSTGTGFVYKTNDDKGYIMTNNHVVDGCDSIQIKYIDGTSATASVAGKEMYSDIAVLTVEKKSVLAVATIGSSSDLRLGDTLFTVGSPMGEDYAGTVTKGILSGKDRLVAVSLSGSVSDYYMRVLQTDSAINPGNSGGPLLNVNGEVIGINSLKLVKDEIEGMGFAIPIEDAIKYAEKLEKGEAIVRPFIGIDMLEASDNQYFKYYNIYMSSDIDHGVLIRSVVEGSPAEKAKLKVGDVITELNGEKTSSIAQFRYELFKYDVNDKIEITYSRDNKEHKVSVTLTERPKD